MSRQKVIALRLCSNTPNFQIEIFDGCNFAQFSSQTKTAEIILQTQSDFLSIKASAANSLKSKSIFLTEHIKNRTLYEYCLSFDSDFVAPTSLYRFSLFDRNYGFALNGRLQFSQIFQ